MAKAITEKFEQLVLRAETDTPGTYARLCGLVGVTVTRTAEMDTVEVPDCDDESLPLSVEKSVRSVSVSISAEGVWAQQSHETMMDWFYSSAPKNIQIENANAAVGDTQFETAPGLLVELTHSREKGQAVQASIQIELVGTPVRTPKA
jgi:hypothetical protein